MSDRYDEIAHDCADEPWPEIAAILRKHFPEPTPAPEGQHASGPELIPGLDVDIDGELWPSGQKKLDEWNAAHHTPEPRKEPDSCPTCKGRGRYNELHGEVPGGAIEVIPCPTCDGTGKAAPTEPERVQGADDDDWTFDAPTEPEDAQGEARAYTDFDSAVDSVKTALEILGESSIWANRSRSALKALEILAAERERANQWEIEAGARLEVAEAEKKRAEAAEREQLRKDCRAIAKLEGRCIEANDKLRAAEQRVRELEVHLDTAQREPYRILWAALSAAGIDRADGCPDSILVEEVEGLRARVRELVADIDRAFGVLSVYGVPKERAKTITNGIDVLMTRIEREVKAIEGNAAIKVADAELALASSKEEASRYREALEKINRNTGDSNMGIIARAALGPKEAT